MIHSAPTLVPPTRRPEPRNASSSREGSVRVVTTPNARPSSPATDDQSVIPVVRHAPIPMSLPAEPLNQPRGRDAPPIRRAAAPVITSKNFVDSVTLTSLSSTVARVSASQQAQADDDPSQVLAQPKATPQAKSMDLPPRSSDGDALSATRENSANRDHTQLAVLSATAIEERRVPAKMEEAWQGSLRLQPKTPLSDARDPVATYRNDPVLRDSFRVFSTSLAQQQQPQLVTQAQRRPSTIPDSPSSPSAGRRSVLGPTHAFTLTSNTDVPIVSAATHLPTEYEERCSNAIGTCTISAMMPVLQPRDDESQCVVDIVGGQQTSFEHSTGAESTTGRSGVAWSSQTTHKAPFRSPEKPVPPPNIQPSFDTTRGDGYAPPSARWERINASAINAIRLVSSKTDDSALAVVPSSSMKPTGASHHVEDGCVTCVVQITCSEQHFAEDPAFDPVGEVRITRCNVTEVSVERLVDLVHRSLNFKPNRRGVLRLFAQDNSIPDLSNVRQHQCISLVPEFARLGSFINIGAFAFVRRSEDRVVKLRWIEDGIAPSTGISISGDFRLMSAPAPANAIPASNRESSVPTMTGFRQERSPVVPTNQLPFPGMMMVAGSNADQEPRMFTGGNEEFLQHDVPVYRVPSRSSSTVHTPHVSPVRSNPPDSWQGTPSFDIRRDPLLTVQDGVKRFSAPVVAAGTVASSGGGSGFRTPETPVPAVATKLASRSGSGSSLSSIVVDGVTYMPKSPRAQKLAEEIAALRAAIASEKPSSDLAVSSSTF